MRGTMLLQRTGSNAWMVKGVLFVLLMTIWASASATSFECGKASSDVEKKICASAKLSNLDSELEVAYQFALSDTNSARTPALVAGQRSWITNVRNNCKDEDCLTREYIGRIQELSSIKVGVIEAKYLLDKDQVEAHEMNLRHDLVSSGIIGELSNCNRTIMVVTQDDTSPQGSLDHQSPTYGSQCLLNKRIVLICDNELIGTLVVKFGPTANAKGDGIAYFAANSCPFGG